MTIFDLLTMLVGLSLFLYGMHVMGEGLSRAAGGRMEQILEKMTSSPAKAVLVGAGVTAVIQSSSAATVMVVGFVDAGILKLSQAVGVIMGANIGTTVTSWLLGLAEIDAPLTVTRLVNPLSFSLVLAIVGLILQLFSSKDKYRNLASVLLGFALLMLGMDAMSGAATPLAGRPEFAGILTRFAHPVWGMLAGLLLTAVIQSSSACLGILQALCVTKAISYGTALPIIMGQNVGTCVTAILAALGAGKNAKRAALVHLYFNLIGTMVFMAVFYAVNALHPLAFLSEAASGLGIAFCHSAFNVGATLLLLPFSKGLVRLACLTVREDASPGIWKRLLGIYGRIFLFFIGGGDF